MNNETIKADFRIEGGGTVYLFRPLTETAREHLETNVQSDAQWFGDALAVEHRYARDLAAQLAEEGYVIQ
jgi:hypothetical protein